MNYYMLFGGTNPGDWAARSLTTSYDYNAPIREWGGVDERYQRVWPWRMLREHGPKLTRADAVSCDVSVRKKTSPSSCAAPGRQPLFVCPDFATCRAAFRHRPREEKTGGADEIVFPYTLERSARKSSIFPRR